jgi:hypothetical protein
MSEVRRGQFGGVVGPDALTPVAVTAERRGNRAPAVAVVPRWNPTGEEQLIEQRAGPASDLPSSTNGLDC